MSHPATDKIVVRTETTTWDLPVQKASLPLGNNPRLALYVPHSEVAARSATIDNRGDAPMIVNHNPFAIYVGREKLEPDNCTVWEPGVVVQLTRSVSLEFSSARQTTSPSQDPHRKSDSSLVENRQFVPLAVVLACCVLGASMLFGGESTTVVEQSVSLEDLNNEVSAMKNLLPDRAEYYEKLQETLRDTLLTDRLFHGRNPQRVVDAYRRLLATEIVRRPSQAETRLADSIKLHGSQRIQQLWAQMSFR